MTMPPAYEPYSNQPGASSTGRLNPLAVVSLVTSILPLYLVGVITGHIALSQTKRTGDRGHGVALAGVILGYIGIAVSLIVGVLMAIAIPVFLGQQAGARDSAVQSDMTNLKIAIVSQIVVDPGGTFPTIEDVSDVFVASSDSQLTLTGDEFGFCIEGYSLSAGANATHFATSDVSSTIEGTCNGGVIVPAP
jgi:type IV pilus assembly protein PilA